MRDILNFVFGVFFLFLFVFYPLTAEAYLGPGLGVGTLGVVFGLLASIIMTFVAIIWYPVKRMIKKKQALKEMDEDE